MAEERPQNDHDKNQGSHGLEGQSANKLHGAAKDIARFLISILP